MTGTCIHCNRDYDLRDAHCDQGQGLPHCEDHRAQCARCHEVFCCQGLKENEDGELLCEECQAIEATPLIQAARRAAATGSHRDLQAYLRARRKDVA